MRERREGDGARAQLSLPALEAAVAVLLVLAIVVGVGFDAPGARTAEAQLETYASDTARLLATDAPDGDDTSESEDDTTHTVASEKSETLLEAVARSPAGFETNQETLSARTASLLPDTVAFRVETPEGAVGFERPRAAAVGRAVVPTRWGRVTVWVWYA